MTDAEDDLCGELTDPMYRQRLWNAYRRLEAQRQRLACTNMRGPYDKEHYRQLPLWEPTTVELQAASLDPKRVKRHKDGKIGFRQCAYQISMFE